MAGSKVMHLHLGAAEMNSRPVVKVTGGGPGSGFGPLVIAARAFLCPKMVACCRNRTLPPVIAMVVRADHYFTGWLVTVDERDDLVVVALEHAVDQEHAVVGHADSKRVGARLRMA